MSSRMKQKSMDGKLRFYSKKRKFWKSTDLIWLIALAALMVLLLFFLRNRPTGGMIAEITYDNKVIDRIELDAAAVGRFSYPENEAVTLEIFADHSIAVVASDCKDQTCVHMGRLRHSGEFSACLPNRVVIRLYPADESADRADGVDIVQ